MHPIQYRDGIAHLEGVSLHELAERLGTPTYVYSSAAIHSALAHMQDALAGVAVKVHYAVKANSNLRLLQLMHEAGTGFDIVSAGELTRVLRAGGHARDVIFSGVGKSTAELDYALKVGIGCFNVESRGELERLANRAELLATPAPVSLRVNPNVDAQTHPYISTGLAENKFGIPIEQAPALYAFAEQHAFLDVVGIDCHIGSQISSPAPLLDALQSILELVDTLQRDGIELQHIDLGGGMGVVYDANNEQPFDMAAYGAGIAQMLHARDLTVYLEPGRSLVANAGILLTRVEYLKPATSAEAPNFAVVDAAMNDLIRPALYQAWHNVLPVQENPHPTLETPRWHLVGPVCESGDFLAHDRALDLGEASLLAIMGVNTRDAAV
ncbi:MAG: diaminopimelate decarboxylase [Pseudomonadota bacterium]